ncbi:MAG TPA: hypothetical protein VNA66_09945 [Gammaproteobacteria bacterium]|nr:hypothetical protein [Gammaproteobacteria bacterium]
MTVEQESPADPRLLAIEHRAREVWEALIERGLERLRQRSADKDKDSIGESTMTKVFAEAVKFMNVEIERVEARARRQYMRDLMAHEQIMAGLRKAH